jgi:hypothetical protein
MKIVKRCKFEREIVDTTVQEKAIAHPLDSRLLEIARHKAVSAAKRVGIVLQQSRRRWRRAARSAVRGRVQHPLPAAGDRGQGAQGPCLGGTCGSTPAIRLAAVVASVTAVRRSQLKFAGRTNTVE